MGRRAVRSWGAEEHVLLSLWAKQWALLCWQAPGNRCKESCGDCTRTLSLMELLLFPYLLPIFIRIFFFFIGKPLQAHSLQNQSLSVLGRLPNIWNHPLKRKSWWGISEWGILACVKDLSLYSLQADCWPSTDSYGSPLLQTVWSGNVSGCSSSLRVHKSTILWSCHFI